MSNYPEGSMRGSGIYVREVSLSVTCSECDHTFDADLQTDDWGRIDQDVICESCSATFNFTWEDDSEGEIDFDSWYDALRDD